MISRLNNLLVHFTKNFCFFFCSRKEAFHTLCYLKNGKEIATSQDMLKIHFHGKGKTMYTVNLCNYDKFNINFSYTFEM